MAKFIAYGVIVEEPQRTVTSNGVDCIEVIFEEKYLTASGAEKLSTYSATFLGNKTHLVPENMRLTGATVIIEGTLKGIRRETTFFVNMYGDNLKVVSSTSPIIDEDGVIKQSMDEIQLPDDDLPF